MKRCPRIFEKHLKPLSFIKLVMFGVLPKGRCIDFDAVTSAEATVHILPEDERGRAALMAGGAVAPAEGAKNPTSKRYSLRAPQRVAEEEFFAPSAAPAGSKASLAVIAAQQVLVSYPWGALAFKDPEIEKAWRM